MNKVRLIDADKLLLSDSGSDKVIVVGARNGKILQLAYELLERKIDTAPTVDAELVVHGKWERFKWSEWGMVKGPGYQCTVCGCDKINGEYIQNPLKYCPNCGARMGGETE